jgi:hypothetical protein
MIWLRRSTRTIGRAIGNFSRATAGSWSIHGESRLYRLLTRATSLARARGFPAPAFWEVNTGWFSDRRTSYLAGGRPVLAEDTGFADDLPAGEGLPTFSDLDEATAGAAEAQCGTSSQLADRKAGSGVP